ncbi:MAG: hypothetical protein AB1540_05675 [Bdellovibrionota bacterium]
MRRQWPNRLVLILSVVWIASALLAIQTHAESYHADEAWRLTEQQAYKKAYKMCSDFAPLETLELAYASGEQVLSEFRIAQPSRELKSFVRNPGFLKAIERCYGKNQTYQYLFLASLVSADMAGKVGAAAVIVKIAQVLKASSAILEFINPTWAIYLNRAFWVGSVASLGAGAYHGVNTYQETKSEWEARETGRRNLKVTKSEKFSLIHGDLFWRQSCSNLRE